MGTPLMDQYRKIKGGHPNEILLFHLGDFYEMFYEDAHTAHGALGITLTARTKGDLRIPMAGFPVHAASGYIRRLMAAGHRVAICDQVEDAAEADGLVDRAVVRVVTPGTLIEEDALDEAAPNHLAAAWRSGDRAGLAWIDLSTGRLRVFDLPAAALLDELSRIAPREILHPQGWADVKPLAALAEMLSPLPDWNFDAEAGVDALKRHFQAANLAGFGCDDLRESLGAAGAILKYLADTHRAPLRHVTRLERFHPAGYVFLDRATQASLELARTLLGGERKGSLLWAVDRTRTPMGARTLRDWILAPLASVEPIRRRHEAVQELIERAALREPVQEALRGLCDVERVVGRLGAARVSPRDLAGLRATLERLPALRARLAEVQSARLRELAAFPLHEELGAYLKRALAENPPPNLVDGGVVCAGFDAELDALRDTATGGREWIAKFQEREIRRTGIPSLKVGYNQVFGYYIEVTNVHREKIPADYTRKQTLKNAERYITPELKEQETKVLHASEQAAKRERGLFESIRERAAADIATLQALAAALAELDVLAGFAQVAQEQRYVRPRIEESAALAIRDGRHPVIEQLIADRFVPNDAALDPEKEQIWILTGPNMAGKSTYLRQVALITLMAQAGSFVPAGEATVGLVDRIFTRSGAVDEITRGASTFLVEMNETANILRHATRRSLVLLDEIGRGTSTYDGLAIAWAVTEYLHEKVGARTIFATHYHELTELAARMPRVVNRHVAVREWGDQVVFLHRVEPGPTDRSYGVHVAQLAGLPKAVVARARQILESLESAHPSKRARPARPSPDAVAQLPLFGPDGPEAGSEELRRLAAEIASLDPNAMRPIDALAALARLAERARGVGISRREP